MDTLEISEKVSKWLQPKLKPCPFCGRAPRVFVQNYPLAIQFKVTVACCSAMELNIMYDEPLVQELKKILGRWNRRVNE